MDLANLQIWGSDFIISWTALWFRARTCELGL